MLLESIFIEFVFVQLNVLTYNLCVGKLVQLVLYKLPFVLTCSVEDFECIFILSVCISPSHTHTSNRNKMF